MKKLVRDAAALVLIVSLAGCEAIPDAASDDLRASWQAHLHWLDSLSVWRTSGRVAVQVPDDGWSASLRWQQRDGAYSIQLSGPFGQGAVRIDGTASEVILRTADGRVRRAPSPEQLIAAELNAELPVSLLRFWILGRPAPEAAVQDLQLDPLGRLQRLEQSGWLITYQDYEAYETGALPSRLRIEHEQNEARFVLGGWRIGG